MLGRQKIRYQFNREGYAIVPNIFNTHQIMYLRKICEAVFNDWENSSSQQKRKLNKKSLDLFKKAEYFLDYPEQLKFLLNTIVDKRIISILKCICERQLFFNGIVYFFNPRGISWHGDWHRDGQLVAPDDEIEKSRVFSSSFIRVHIALINDDFLEIVPNSHSRWDTTEESEIRKGLNSHNNSDSMPYSHRVHLNPGDAVFFDGYSIHRGNYLKDKPRRTLAILYGSHVDWFTPTLNDLIRSQISTNLPLRKQTFFCC